MSEAAGGDWLNVLPFDSSIVPPLDKPLTTLQTQGVKGVSRGERSHPLTEGETTPLTLTPPEPGKTISQKIVTPEWSSDALIKYRKRVYVWWAKANDPKRLPETRKANHDKARKAFAWFKEHGCAVEIKPHGKVSIRFPKSDAHE